MTDALENLTDPFEQFSALECEVKSRMDEVYLGHWGRPQYSNLDRLSKHFGFDRGTIRTVVFSHFLDLLDDRPVGTVAPRAGLTEQRKLYGAFSSYADYDRTGYNTMFGHRGDPALGRRIISRFKRSTFADESPSSQNGWFRLASCFAVGVHVYDRILGEIDKCAREQNSPLLPSDINGRIKERVIMEIRRH